jgi:hypothetical protein
VWQVDGKKGSVITRGDLPGKKKLLAEVSRGHSTEKKIGKD